jgi:uncharacterized protein
VIYVDTSVLVALHLNEPNSHLAERWFASCTKPMVSALWCVTEFASALGIKRRTGQISVEQSAEAWSRFERQCANELQLVPLEASSFHKAALLTFDPDSKLRAGDSLHLACAVALKVDAFATFDTVLATHCVGIKMGLVFPISKGT